MRSLLFALAALLIIASPAAAQRLQPRFELGTSFGLESLSRRGEDVTALGLNSFDGRGGYLSIFFSPQILLQNNVGIATGGRGTSLHVGSDLAFLPRGSGRASPYVFTSVASSLGDGPSITGGAEWALGGGLGFRVPLTDRFSLATEVGYRRWFHDAVNQLGFTVKLGINFGGKR